MPSIIIDPPIVNSAKPGFIDTYIKGNKISTAELSKIPIFG